MDTRDLARQFAGIRALIVDDVPMNIEILTHQLECLGMVVAAAADGFAGLAEIERAWHRSAPYDLIMIDQMMPGLSGSELARRIRAMPTFTESKLVLVSSAGPHGTPRAGEKLFDAVLAKPVRQRDLLEGLRRLYASGLQSGVAEQETPVPADTQASPRPPLRVLLAEDNRINQQFAAALLGKAGHAVTFARNGHEAVDAVRNTVFDVVLMDVQMPGMDGLEATKHIRSLPAPACSVPIIALTAHAMQGAREEYIAAGMDDYVSKPIKPALLLRKMASIARNPADDADRSPCSVAPVLESANQEPLLDSEVLDGLRDLFPTQQMHEYIGLFRASTAERLDRMNAAAAAMDVAGTRGGGTRDHGNRRNDRGHAAQRHRPRARDGLQARRGARAPRLPRRSFAAKGGGDGSRACEPLRRANACGGLMRGTREGRSDE